jgi:hypothetical protein
MTKYCTVDKLFRVIFHSKNHLISTRESISKNAGKVNITVGSYKVFKVIKLMGKKL